MRITQALVNGALGAAYVLAWFAFPKAMLVIHIIVWLA